MKEQDRLRSLQQIQDIAQKMKAFAAHNHSFPSHLLSTPKARCKINITPLRFPSINEITKVLLDSGVSEDILQMSLDTVMDTVVSLQATYSRSYEQTALRILDLPMVPASTSVTERLERLRITYESLFIKQHIPAISKVVSDAYLRSSQHKRGDGKKLTFNNEYTPLLEKYFEYNAYPSAPDREVLARKSFMTQRQIEVWFQNHRNRAKKEGRFLRRYQHVNLSENTSLDTLCDNISSKSKILDFEGDTVGGLHEKDLMLKSSKAVAVTLNDSTPSYTFPTPYKSRYPQNPLIMPSQDIKKLFKFSSPEWGRKPVTRLALVPVMEVEDLASAFTSKLNLRRRTSKEQSRQNSPVDSHNHSWFAHRVTIPSPAPHPALIRTQIQTFIGPTLSSLSSWVAGLGRKPTKDSPHTTQPAELCQNAPDIRRKKQLYDCKASLEGLGRRSGYPTSIVIPGSRTSSCSSTDSTDSLISSSSSTSSLSTPSTSPISLSLPLPEVNFVLQNQLLDELFGHYPPELTFLDREPAYKTCSPHNPLKIPSLITV